MEKELRGLVLEIILTIIMMIIIIPICADASSEYRKTKEALLSGRDAVIDISNNRDMKKVTVYNNYDKKVRINLFLKVNDFSGDYDIYFENSNYKLNDLEYVLDNGYRYYQLGIYEVDVAREFDFKFIRDNYVETIIYSFVTEGFMWLN